MATMATCAIPIPSLPRNPQRLSSQISLRTKQLSQSRFLLNTGNLEVCNSEGVVEKWRVGVSFFPPVLKKGKSREEIKEELLEAIEPLDRGAEATPEDQERIDQSLKFLRPNGKMYHAVNADKLRAQNMETWPYFSQATANLAPLSSKRAAVRFDTSKLFGFIPIKAPGRGRGELEITYLDEEIR